MTRDKILAMKPGRELDALVAEKVMGWRRIRGPKFDYDGPVETGDILIPPTITSDDEAFRYMPPRGTIPFYYFVTQRYSTDISAAFEALKASKFSVEIMGHYHTGWSVTVGEKYTAKAWELPDAISKAALLAVMDE